MTNSQNTDLVATDFVDKVTCSAEARDDLNYLLDQFSLDESIQENIQALVSFNVPIWLDLDSTKLQFHEQLCKTLSDGKYSSLIIVFNFPHVHNIKMKINLNRDLLRDTFCSIEALLDRFPHLKKPTGCNVYISLCHGQSGLNEVEPKEQHRSWADSWQLTEMAAGGNFALINVIPFGAEFTELLVDQTLHLSKREFEHNYKCFVDSTLNSSISDHLEHTAIHQSFGYRLQNRPFNHPALDNRFKGGNVFSFEHRDDIMSSLGQNEMYFT